MVKKKFVKCLCSSSHLRKGEKPDKPGSLGQMRAEPTFEFDKCECTVDGKPVTKIGRDNVVVDVKISRRKGYEAHGFGGLN